MTRYWVAHSLGADFSALERVGFTTFYPSVDDYAFLEACPGNRRLLKREERLCIEFLRGARGEFLTVGEDEVEAMAKATVRAIVAGARVRAVRGVAEGLEGEVLEEVSPMAVRVRVEGYSMEFDLVLDRSELVPSEGGTEPGGIPQQ